jgi:hypothetical protein
MTTLFLLTGFGLHAQNAAVSAQSPYRNVFKINVSSLALMNGSFQYERTFGGRVSFALGMSYMPTTNLPFSGALIEQYGDNADARHGIEITEMSMITVTPEIRFYSGHRGAPDGFYVAPFIRYTQMELLEKEYSFTAKSGNRYYPDVQGSLSYIGAGLMLGYQFPLARRFSLDIWIAGPYVGSMNGKFTGFDATGNLSAADQQNLKEDIESFRYPLMTVEATVGPQEAEAILGGGMIGIRALGFAFGFRF